MIKFSSTNWGGGWKIHVQGEAKELAVEVTRLFNFGVFSEIPENFDAGKDTAVILDTYPPRLFGGARAIASNEMQVSGLRHTVRPGKKKWQAIETFRAAHIARLILGTKMEVWKTTYLPNVHGQGTIKAERGDE